MSGKEGNAMASDMQRTAPRTQNTDRARRRGLSATAVGLTLAGLSAISAPAHAAVADQEGQPVGVAIQAALFACSTASIIGNSVNIVQKNPQRGWLYSGFICGFTNALIGPITLIYFRDPEPAYGITTGFVHTALGLTNLGVAIYNGVLWHRAKTAGQEPPKVSLLPVVGRDSLGASVVGLSFSVTQY